MTTLRAFAAPAAPSPAAHDALAEAPRPTTGGVRRLSPRQRRLFLLTIAVLAPLLVLGSLEGALRLAGYGGYPPTFRSVGTLPDGSALVFTDHGGPGSYFFANRSLPGSLDRTALVMPKPARNFRIMIVGESAAKGNPYPRALSSGAFLRAMLADLWPDRTVEVVNLGTTAIASFPALGMLTEALDYSPDLVVAYLGNNEYYGAYGVASLHTAGRSPAMIRLIRATRALAIAQFIDRRLLSPRARPPTTLMEAMIGQSYIAPNDPARAAASRNLETFVGAMIDRCRARRVPLLVCTPPANERDLAPLGSPDLARLTADARRSADEGLRAARAAIETDPEGAAASLRRVLGIAPEHATAHYLLGRALHAGGLFAEAGSEFQAAIDLDPMPWRPPGDSVNAIRRAIASHAGVLCDLQQAFRDASPGGAVGWELMDDHVHPSLRGQDLVARTIVRTLAALPGPPAVEPAAAGTLPDWTVYAARLGANKYDAYAAAHAMRLLAGIGFFKETNPQFFERSDAVCRAVENESPPEVVQQIRAWEDPATHRSENRPISGMVGRALYRLNRAAEAEPLFRVAAESVTPYGSWNLEFVWLMLACRRDLHGAIDENDRREALEAIERGRFLIATGRSTTGAAERYVGELHQLRGEFTESIPYLQAARQKLTDANRLAADESLVRALVNLGRGADARAVVDEGLRAGGPLADAYRQMAARLGAN